MADSKAALTTALRERGVLDDDDPLVVAWNGRLVKFSGANVGVDLTEPPVAVLGVSARTGHLLSRFGLMSFALTELKTPHSLGPGHLGFAVARDDGARITVGLAVEMPLAIADQLREMSHTAADRTLVTAHSEAIAARRPSPKQRTEGRSS